MHREVKLYEIANNLQGWFERFLGQCFFSELMAPSSLGDNKRGAMNEKKHWLLM
jgi:hypothetical protein